MNAPLRWWTCAKCGRRTAQSDTVLEVLCHCGGQLRRMAPDKIASPAREAARSPHHAPTARPG